MKKIIFDSLKQTFSFSGSGGIQIAKTFRRAANSIHAPSPTTNFLSGECEDGDENNQVGMALGPTEEQVGTQKITSLF